MQELLSSYGFRGISLKGPPLLDDTVRMSPAEELAGRSIVCRAQECPALIL